MKASSKIKQLFVLSVGRVKHSKMVYITDLTGSKIYLESKDIPRLVEDLQIIKAEVDDNG